MSAEEKIITLVVFELIVLQISRITSASMVFNAEFVASMAIFTVVFKDVAVVHAWYPGIGWR